MSEINLSSFLANDQEAIAFLYVQNQDLSGLSPEEIYDKYRDAYIFYVQEYCIIFGQPSQSEHVFDGCYFYT